jgi:ubiquinone/menaquinone biosynthesis C-methylase UbiE
VQGNLDTTNHSLVNAEVFGKYASCFESCIVPLWQGVYDDLVRRAGISKDLSVLDVGTGTGEVALRVSQLVGPGGRVLGVDVQDEMLAFARRKARGRKLANLDFRQMPAEDLDLPDSQFDSVVGNYSLCCCLDYVAALKECHRVLKPGGSMTYNHFGPNDPIEVETAYDILESYKPRAPSKKLKALRDSDSAQMKAFEKYRDPKVALAAMKRAGFSGVKSSTVSRRISYGSAAGYVDRMIDFDWASEVEEMEAEDVREMRKEAIAELSSLSRGPGFTIKDETLYFTGTK